MRSLNYVHMVQKRTYLCMYNICTYRGWEKREQVQQSVGESRYTNVHCTILLIYYMFKNSQKPLDKQLKYTYTLGYACVCVCVCVCVCK